MGIFGRGKVKEIKRQLKKAVKVTGIKKARKEREREREDKERGGDRKKREIDRDRQTDR